MRSLAFLLAVCATTFTPKHLAAQPDTRGLRVNNDTLVVALTVEGGGTLGSYEGGLTWALVEIFRQRRDSILRRHLTHASDSVLLLLPTVDLRAAAGASAGSINAYMAANQWCSRDVAEVVDSSAFWRVWVPTGMRQLLPGRDRIGDRREKGILSRIAFNDVFESLDRKWSRAHYNSPCTVLFGATVTRIQRDSVGVVAGEVYARNQRFAAAFTIVPPADTGKSPPSYAPSPSLNNSQFSLGALAELPLLPDNTIDRVAARNLIRASSGYPLAFEPQELAFCADSPPAAHTRKCDASSAVRSFFVDGGVFDNGPVTLSYGLALAHPTRTTLGNLTMLFVTPNQFRAAEGVTGSNGSSSMEKRHDPEIKSGGLDAVTKLFAAFVPSARQYELQIAHRLLPTIEVSGSQVDLLTFQRDSARRAFDNLDRYVRDLEARARERDQAVALADSLRQRADTARYQLAVCLVNGGCTASFDDSARALGAAPVFQATAKARIPDRASYLTADERPRFLGQSFEKSLYATRRWHSLSGDWLLGFGGLLGRPLREYDFYVGVYDALTLIASRMLCVYSPKPNCVKETVGDLIEHPLLPLTRSDSTILAALYNEEFGNRSDVQNLAKHPRREATVLPVVWAMADWKRNRAAITEKCGGGPIETFECTEGIEFVFGKLKDTPGYIDRLESAPAECLEKKIDTSECITDEDFARIVAHPYAALNKLAGKMLARVAETTPRNSGMMMPLSLGMAMYFATNERARLGFDMGSTSLPTGRPLPSRLFFAAIPSSVGGFAGVEGWYFEWAARYHFGRSIALGATARAVLMSGITHPRGANEDHAVPGLRLEWKIPGPVGPWISTLGVDATTWTDGVTWPTRINNKTASWGGTALLLAQRIRVSVQQLPSKYVIRGRDRPLALVSIGFGDTNGFVYWLGRRLFAWVR